MDFDLSRPQRDRLDSSSNVLSRRPCTEADIRSAGQGTTGQRYAPGRFGIGPVHDRRGAVQPRPLRARFGLYALVCDLLPDGIPSGRVAIVESTRNGPVRFCRFRHRSWWSSTHDRAYLHDQSTITTPARANWDSATRFGPRGGLRTGPATARRRRRNAYRARWAAGAYSLRSPERTARPIAKTADHLKARRQFGRPLATFQALRPTRLADAAVVPPRRQAGLGRGAAFVEHPRTVLRAGLVLPAPLVTNSRKSSRRTTMPAVKNRHSRKFMVSSPAASLRAGSGMVGTWSKHSCKRAEEDDKVKAVILKVDSPGGEVWLRTKSIARSADFQTHSKKAGHCFHGQPCRLRWVITSLPRVNGSSPTSLPSPAVSA